MCGVMWSGVGVMWSGVRYIQWNHLYTRHVKMLHLVLSPLHTVVQCQPPLAAHTSAHCTKGGRQCMFNFVVIAGACLILHNVSTYMYMYMYNSIICGSLIAMCYNVYFILYAASSGF